MIKYISGSRTLCIINKLEFGLNPQARSSRISQIPPKDEFGTPVSSPQT